MVEDFTSSRRGIFPTTPITTNGTVHWIFESGKNLWIPRKEERLALATTDPVQAAKVQAEIDFITLVSARSLSLHPIVLFAAYTYRAQQTPLWGTVER